MTKQDVRKGWDRPWDGHVPSDVEDAADFIEGQKIFRKQQDDLAEQKRRRDEQLQREKERREQQLRDQAQREQKERQEKRKRDEEIARQRKAERQRKDEEKRRLDAAKKSKNAPSKSEKKSGGGLLGWVLIAGGLLFAFSMLSHH